MSATNEESSGTAAVRPFRIPVTPDADIEALRARVAATRWPDQELVTDSSQGPKLAVCRNSPATGRRNTTGADARRN